MKLPKRIDQLVKRKEAYLEMIRGQLEKSVIRLQGVLFAEAVESIIPRLDVKDGIILDTANNYRLISELNKIYSAFDKKIINTLLPQITSAIDKIGALNENLMSVVMGVDMSERFTKVIEATKKITDLRMGLSGGKMVRGGFLESLFKGDPTELQQFMSKAVSSQIPTKEFINGIKANLTGTEEKIGSMERKFQRFAYDTYQQYDRSYNKSLAEEFGMTYFAYQGGLVVDSRDFCVAHNNKVWSIEETKTWATWTPSEGEYPAGYEIKSKSPDEIPSYLGYPGYDPLVDLGGYNCRHVLQPIPDELAFKLRSELRK